MTIDKSRELTCKGDSNYIIKSLSCCVLTPTEEEDPDEWLTQTVNVLGTDCQDALISPLIEIQEQIMDKGAWINPEMNSV